MYAVGTEVSLCAFGILVSTFVKLRVVRVLQHGEGVIIVTQLLVTDHTIHLRIKKILIKLKVCDDMK